jgi:hypothetical protein
MYYIGYGFVIVKLDIQGDSKLLSEFPWPII